MVTKITSLLAITWCLFSSLTSNASPENDRLYALESLSWIKPVDNVDGIFNDFVDETFDKYFARQTRFQIKKLGNTNAILGNSKIPYYKLANDPDVLRKVSRQFKVESLLRTKIAREGTSYRFQIEWIYGPRGDILAQQEFRYYDTAGEKGIKGSDLPEALNKALDELIKKLPFLGQITGVEGDTVTVNMGRNQGVSVKEIMTIFTLKALKRHPLERTIEEWSWEPVGKVQIDQVEESITFGKIIFTEPGMTFDRYQKVREILPAPAEKENKKQSKIDSLENMPRIGWVAGNVGIGSYSREVGYPATSGSSGFGGGGLTESLQVDSQLWLNSRWIVQGSLGTALINYHAKNLATGADLGSSYSGTNFNIRVAGGYAFYPAKTIFDPIGWVHAGYRSTSYTLTKNVVQGAGSSSFGSFFIGLGGEVPVNEEFSAQMGFDLGLIRSFDESDLAFGDTGSTSDLMFTIGGSYRYTEKIFFRALFIVNSQSADFKDGHSISQKTFSLMPSVMYYF